MLIGKFLGRNKVAARKCRQRRVVGETDTPMPSTSNEQVQNQRFYVRPVCIHKKS
jgi:hypothetical protein